MLVPLRDVLEIDSTAAVTLVVASLVAALVTPIAIGALLGYQRFYAVALLSVLPFALRLVVVAGTAVAGYRLGGAATATFLSAVVTALVAAIWLIRTRLARGARSARPALSPFLRYLVPVVVGLIGIAALTNLDVLIVKARFPAAEAGDYAAASAFAKVAFFVPAALLAVVFPRTAARQARGERTEDILGRSLLATAAFCGGLALFYALAGRGLLVLSYGAEYAEGGAVTASSRTPWPSIRWRTSSSGTTCPGGSSVRVDRRGRGTAPARRPRARAARPPGRRLGQHRRCRGS